MTNIENYKNQLKLNGYLHIRNFLKIMKLKQLENMRKKLITLIKKFHRNISIDKINKIFCQKNI